MGLLILVSPIPHRHTPSCLWHWQVEDQGKPAHSPIHSSYFIVLIAGEIVVHLAGPESLNILYSKNTKKFLIEKTKDFIFNCVFVYGGGRPKYECTWSQRLKVTDFLELKLQVFSCWPPNVGAFIWTGILWKSKMGSLVLKHLIL